MAQLYADNTDSATLLTGINSSDLSIVLASGKGALFPSPTGGDYFVLTLSDPVTPETKWERVKITARSTDTLTVPAGGRGYDGSTAQSWVTGDRTSIRWGNYEAKRSAAQKEFEGGVLLGESDAAAPAADLLLVNARRFGGSATDPGMIGLFYRVAGEQQWPIMPAMMGPANWTLWRGGLASPAVLGITTGSAQGTLTGPPAFATTSLATRQLRSNYLSASSANAVVGFRQGSSTGYHYRSTTDGRGGFFFHARIVLDANMGANHARLFVGLRSVNNDPVAGDPSATSGDFVAVACDAADTNLRLMTRNNTTTTNTDLGASAPKTAGLMYDVYFYCPPGGAKIYYRIDKSDGNTFTERVVEGSVTATLPSTDVPLMQFVQGATSTTTPVTLGIAQFGCVWQSN